MLQIWRLCFIYCIELQEARDSPGRLLAELTVRLRQVPSQTHLICPIRADRSKALKSFVSTQQADTTRSWDQPNNVLSCAFQKSKEIEKARGRLKNCSFSPGFLRSIHVCSAWKCGVRHWSGGQALKLICKPERRAELFQGGSLPATFCRAGRSLSGLAA